MSGKYCKTCRMREEDCTCPKAVATFNYELKRQDIAGFDLCGWKLPDGRYQMMSGQILPGLPKEVEILGNTYTFEDETLGSTDKDGRVFFNAMYV